MFVFFFFKNGVELNDIKNIIKELSIDCEKLGADITNTNKKLADNIQEASFAMFSKLKLDNPNFTVQNNYMLRNVKIDEDAEGFDDDATLEIQSYFKDNIEAFMELVSVAFLQTGTQRFQRKNKILMCNAYSKYSAKQHEIFIAQINKKHYVLKETVTDILLNDYLNNYFTALSDDDEKQLSEFASSDDAFIESLKKMNNFFSNLNNKTKNSYDFKSGAITFLDFLAWKGLWQSDKDNNALKNVSVLIDDFKDKLTEISSKLFSEADEINLSSLISISDTIAIFTPKTYKTSECDLLKLHAELSKYILENCAKAKYPIRGAISYGDYSIMNNIMIGPGIDECASWHETGNWIGVHFTPTAEIYLNDYFEKNPNDDVIIEINPPLKDKLICRFCVKWNIEKNVYNQMALNTNALLPEIAGKYTHTYDFLKNNIWGGGKEHGKK